MRDISLATAMLLLVSLPALAETRPDTVETASRAPAATRLADAQKSLPASVPLPVARSERPVARVCSDMRCPTFIVLGTGF